MMSILLSIEPKYAELIASGKKTIEVRKSAPKEVPFKAYIYVTRPKIFYKCGAVRTSDELLWLANGKVEMGDGFKFWADGDEYRCLNGCIIGEFICDRVIEWKYLPDDVFPSWLRMYYISADDGEKTCLSYREIEEYGKGKTLYGWHISDLKIYDKPKELNEFCIPCKTNCEDCKKPLFYDCWKEKGKIKVVTRPPQSYMFVKE